MFKNEDMLKNSKIIYFIFIYFCIVICQPSNNKLLHIPEILTYSELHNILNT